MAEQLYLDRAIAEGNDDFIGGQYETLLESFYLNKVVFDYALGSGSDEFVLDVDDQFDSLLRDHAQWSQDAQVFTQRSG